MIKTCKVCNKEFEANHFCQKCCSDECKRINHLENMRKSNSHNLKKNTKTNEFYEGEQCKKKNCMYKGTTKIMGEYPCDYTLMTGRSRGCEAKECNKYEKRTSARKKNQICSGV